MARTQYDPLDPYAVLDDTAGDGYDTNGDARQTMLDSMNGGDAGRVGITDPGQGPNKTAPAPTSEGADQRMDPTQQTTQQTATGGAGMAGFDPSRMDSNTLKYNAMRVLQGLDPNDPNSIQTAFQTLNAQYPGQYQLDGQGNLLLTGTADGYIGARPQGWGSGGAWQEPNGSNYDWQWLAYNDAHQGPNGEGVGSGSLSGDGVTMNGLNQWGAPIGSPDSYRPPPGGAGASAPRVNPMLQYVQTLLQNLLTQTQVPITADSANINPALTAYKGERSNALADERNALAERSYAKGLGTNSGEFDAGLAGAQEKAGQDTSAFGANLIYKANQDRTQQLQQLLQLATSFGLTDQAQQLQDEIQRLQLGYNYTALNANLNQSALLAGLG